MVHHTGEEEEVSVFVTLSCTLFLLIVCVHDPPPSS